MFFVFPVVASSSEQATCMLFSLGPGSDPTWTRRAGVCSVADKLMQGSVDYTNMKQRPFDSKGVSICFGLICRSIDLFTFCKYADANRFGRASLTHTQVLCYGVPRVQDNT